MVNKCESLDFVVDKAIISQKTGVIGCTDGTHVRTQTPCKKKTTKTIEVGNFSVIKWKHRHLKLDWNAEYWKSKWTKGLLNFVFQIWFIAKLFKAIFFRFYNQMGFSTKMHLHGTLVEFLLSCSCCSWKNTGMAEFKFRNLRGNWFILDQKTTMADFYKIAGWPRVIGAVDGLFIPISQGHHIQS